MAERMSARKAGGAAPRLFDDLLGPDAKLSVRNDSCYVYQLENATGTGLITIYDVFPGVTLYYNDLHLRKINGHDERPMPGGADMLIINHCREGRLECEFNDGEFGYLGEGDLAVSA
ncbi:MAG: hypothetical protein LBD49_01650, partial [Oscillospiraceae bacterium]|nr:hypothetical protein [Oscillospiraceae bacterium]